MARKKIGDMLCEHGLITQAQLEEALIIQEQSGVRLGEVLVNKGHITENELVGVMAERLTIPKVSLDMMVIDPAVISLVPVEIARRYTLVPIFAIGNTLTLAMEDPLNIIAIDEIRYQTGSEIKRSIATSTEIKDAINQYYTVADSMDEIIGTGKQNKQNKVASSVAQKPSEADSPVVKLVDLIISKAVKAKASDIHIEPDETTLRVRYRVNGIMREEADPPKSMQNEIVSRIKVSSNLDVSEKRLPQDGRMGVMIDNNPIDLRVSTLPTIHGEKIVIRILDRRNLMLTFKQLGIRSRMIEQWNNLIRKPEGLVLISGPTSSGKTSTLYTSLLEVNSMEKNIITVEDPVEFSLPLINQIQINEKAGLTFPSTLRSMLRQNPDIIMIGEIRDKETAQMAVRSSMTGHLVFSTIHTNDAASAITRLIDMGVEPYLVASALNGVVAQRLVRKNCEHCREVYEPLKQLIQRANLEELAGAIEFKKGVGCTHCRQSGFGDLTGIFEMIEISPPIAEQILEGSSLAGIRETARNFGYLPLFEAGLEKLTAGEICLEELLSQTSNIEDYFAPAKNVISNAQPV